MKTSSAGVNNCTVCLLYSVCRNIKSFKTLALFQESLQFVLWSPTYIKSGLRGSSYTPFSISLQKVLNDGKIYILQWQPLNCFLTTVLSWKWHFANPCLTPHTVTVRYCLSQHSGCNSSDDYVFWIQLKQGPQQSKLVPQPQLWFFACRSSHVVQSQTERNGICSVMLAPCHRQNRQFPEQKETSPMGKLVCIFLRGLSWNRDMLLINDRKKVDGRGRGKSDYRQST